MVSECPYCGKCGMVSYAYHWACLICGKILRKEVTDSE